MLNTPSPSTAREWQMSSRILRRNHFPQRLLRLKPRKGKAMVITKYSCSWKLYLSHRSPATNIDCIPSNREMLSLVNKGNDLVPTWLMTAVSYVTEKEVRRMLSLALDLTRASWYAICNHCCSSSSRPGFEPKKAPFPPSYLFSILLHFHNTTIAELFPCYLDRPTRYSIQHIATISTKESCLLRVRKWYRGSFQQHGM